MVNCFTAVILLSVFGAVSAQFDPSNATIDDVWRAISTGSSTCRQIVQAYLDRIRCNDKAGPQLDALISQNPNALAEADALDTFYQTNRVRRGDLHCVTMIIKDNIDVAGIPTTNGLNAFRNQTPLIDSVVVRNVKQAGAIIIGKANMSPLSDMESWGNSQTGGLIRNPYDITRSTYGSSGGNGAGAAAGFATIGLGAETGVSINLPSSAANVVGIRVPVNLVNLEGALPNHRLQDVIGPMGKRVRDVARVLDAMLGRRVATYSCLATLNANGLRGMRINIMQNFLENFQIPNLPPYTLDPQIATLFNRFVSNLQQAGAIVRNVSLPQNAFPALINMMGLNTDACVVDWRNAYLNDTTRFGANSPFHSVADVVNANQLPTVYQNSWNRWLSLSNAANCTQQLQVYQQGRQTFINDVLNPLLANADLAVAPTIPELPRILDNDAFNQAWDSTNRPPINPVLLGSLAAYAAMDVPMGFSDPIPPSAPQGVPVGAYLLTHPLMLHRLFRAAYAYQINYGDTRTPSSVVTTC